MKEIIRSPLGSDHKISATAHRANSTRVRSPGTGGPEKGLHAARHDASEHRVSLRQASSLRSQRDEPGWNCVRIGRCDRELVFHLPGSRALHQTIGNTPTAIGRQGNPGERAIGLRSVLVRTAEYGDDATPGCRTIISFVILRVLRGYPLTFNHHRTRRHTKESGAECHYIAHCSIVWTDSLQKSPSPPFGQNEKHWERGSAHATASSSGKTYRTGCRFRVAQLSRPQRCPSMHLGPGRNTAGRTAVFPWSR